MENRARGKPVPIGFINQEGTGRASIVNLRLGTEAAVKYVNAERGGLNGRPIELRPCVTNGSPESSAACAHRMVEQKVIAVRAGIDLGSAASLPILKAAGIPYLGPLPLLPADFTTDNAFAFVPGGVGNAASAAYIATELKAKRVTVLHSDEAPGPQLANAFVRPALLKGGVPPSGIKMLAEKADAADLTGLVAAGNEGSPDAIVVLMSPPACPRIMQAAAVLRVKAPTFYIEPCGDPAVLRAAGAGAEGVYFNGAFLNVEANKDDSDVQLYLDKIAEYGAAGLDKTSVEAMWGFALTMTVYDRLAELTGPLTSAAVTATFKAAKNAPGFMTHRYTCDGRQAIPAFISVCNGHVRLYQFKGGRYRDVVGDWVSASAALKQ